MSQTVSSVIVEELKAGYDLKTRETDHIKKQIAVTFENEVRKNEIERKITEAHIKGRVAATAQGSKMIRIRKIRFKKILKDE